MSVFVPSSMLHSRVLGEQTQLKEEMETLRRDNAQLVREHNHLKQSCEELKRLHGQDQAELADLRLQQQQVHTRCHTQMHSHALSCPEFKVMSCLWRFTDGRSNLHLTLISKNLHMLAFQTLVFHYDFY